jgi:hypothetical protein
MERLHLVDGGEILVAEKRIRPAALSRDGTTHAPGRCQDVSCRHGEVQHRSDQVLQTHRLWKTRGGRLDEQSYSANDERTKTIIRHHPSLAVSVISDCVVSYRRGCAGKNRGSDQLWTRLSAWPITRLKRQQAQPATSCEHLSSPRLKPLIHFAAG